MNLTYKVRGLPELKRTIDALIVAMQPNPRLREVALKPAQAMEQEAKNLVAVRSGNLQEHITSFPAPQGPGAILGVFDVPYAAAVEYGSSKLPAQPFMRPAMRAVEPTALNMIGEGVDQLLTEVANSTALKIR